VRRLPLIFVLVVAFGVLELYLLLEIGAAIGAGATLGLLLASALVGFYVGRAQGLGVFRRWVASEASGDVAEEGLVDGLLVLAGSVMLVVPGVLSGALGLVLLVPPVRRKIAERLRLRAAGWVQAGAVQVLGVEPEQDGFEGEEDEDDGRERVHAAPLRFDVRDVTRGRRGGQHHDAHGPEDEIEVLDVEGVAVEEKPTRLLGP
jgi:UPF0716 protein FxsA